MVNAATSDCWNSIGVIGNGSCPELEQHIHCRNCPVYTAAASRLLDRSVSTKHLQEWTDLFSRPLAPSKSSFVSVVVFRVEDEWLALPTRVCHEVAEQSPFHTLPHRTGGAITGVVNIRGELVVCASLKIALKFLNAGSTDVIDGRSSLKRLLVAGRDANRFAFPVSEVFGTHRYDPQELKAIPATLSADYAPCTEGMLSWNNLTVGCLNDNLLFNLIEKSFS